MAHTHKRLMVTLCMMVHALGTWPSQLHRTCGSQRTAAGGPVSSEVATRPALCHRTHHRPLQPLGVAAGALGQRRKLRGRLAVVGLAAEPRRWP